MLRKTQIWQEDGKGFYTMFHHDDFEYVNPIEHYTKSYLATNTSMMRDLFKFKKVPVPQPQIEAFIQKEVTKDWEEKLMEIQNSEIPEYLTQLLNSESKKEQVKLLKGASITPDQLIAFIFFAWTNYGFTFSQYTVEHQHKGFDRKKMPKIVEVKDGKVNKIGKTDLTDGQLKQTVDHRKVIVSKFFDKSNVWHCFFLTFESLKGKESWKGGQPHYHYISDKFAIPRDKVVQELKSSNYNLGNLPHIDLLDYRTDE